jgi:hypothetical protein
MRICNSSPRRVGISAGRLVLDGRGAALVVARDVTERRELQEPS